MLLGTVQSTSWWVSEQGLCPCQEERYSRSNFTSPLEANSTSDILTAHFACPVLGSYAAPWYWELPLLLGLLSKLANTEVTITPAFTVSLGLPLCYFPSILGAQECMARLGAQGLMPAPLGHPEGYFRVREIYITLHSPMCLGGRSQMVGPWTWSSQYTGFGPHTCFLLKLSNM